LVVAQLVIGQASGDGPAGDLAGPAPKALGLAPGDAEQINDDRVGRALERLFDADRASLLGEEGGCDRAPISKYASLVKAIVGLFFFAAYE